MHNATNQMCTQNDMTVFSVFYTTYTGRSRENIDHVYVAYVRNGLDYKNDYSCI